MKEFADKKALKINALGANIHALAGDALYEGFLAGYVCFKRN
jgi:hypothetical protein